MRNRKINSSKLEPCDRRMITLLVNCFVSRHLMRTPTSYPTFHQRISKADIAQKTQRSTDTSQRCVFRQSRSVNWSNAKQRRFCQAFAGISRIIESLLCVGCHLHQHGFHEEAWKVLKPIQFVSTRSISSS